jgi:hypothetical protein
MARKSEKRSSLADRIARDYELQIKSRGVLRPSSAANHPEERRPPLAPSSSDGSVRITW